MLLKITDTPIDLRNVRLPFLHSVPSAW